jgi:hypothetical protein
MTEKYKPWEEDPDQRKAGPVRFVERKMLDEDPKGGPQVTLQKILQVYCWSEYSDEYMAAEKPQQTGERVWVDVPLEEE